MRLFAWINTVPTALCLQLLLAPAAMAADETSRTLESPANSDPVTTQAIQPEVTLDALFAELLRERDPKQARKIADRINAMWNDSGSASANLIMQWAAKAMSESEHSLALDLLDQVTVLWPNYAEGWNRRATLHFIMGDFSKSMADINRVLTIEPRHFGALAGMAAILERGERDKQALRVWEQLLTVFPSNRQAQSKVGELAEKLAGRRT